MLVEIACSAALCAAVGLGARRIAVDRGANRRESELLSDSKCIEKFCENHLSGLPDAAQRFLRHAITPGTPLYHAVRLQITGEMTPSPSSGSVALTATETLAPREGFVWTAWARVKGFPTRVRDHYYKNHGAVNVELVGLFPVATPSDENVARSSRDRLIAEAVWCPTALVHKSVTWENVDANRAKYTFSVDGETVSVTIRVGKAGNLVDATLLRWGDVDGVPWRAIPYGFLVDEEKTFDGVTIPSKVFGGWWYGTRRFNAGSAASFTVKNAKFQE